MRYRLLETIREFAAARNGPDEAAALHERHARYYEAFFRHPGPWRPEFAGKEALEDRERERDNLLAALEWSLERNPLLCLHLCRRLGLYWCRRSYLEEGRAWTSAALERCAEATHKERAEAFDDLGTLCVELGDLTGAAAAAEQALRLRDEEPDRISGEDAWQLLARVALERGRPDEALSCLRRSRQEVKRCGHLQEPTLRLCRLGDALMGKGAYERAARLCRRSLEHARRLGCPFITGCALHYSGLAAFLAGAEDRAAALLTEALALRRGLGERNAGAKSMHALALLAIRRGDLAAARSLMRESLEIRRQVGSLTGIASSLEGLASLARREGCAARAALLMGAAASVREATGAAVPPAEVAERDLCLTAARAALGERGFDRQWSTGRAMSWQEAATLALAPDAE
jgi:tetratricopeptide (TPR) repeat protein